LNAMSPAERPEGGEAGKAGGAPRRRVLVALLPLLVALAVGGFFVAGLDLKPRDIPSALIGKPLPQFDLPAIPGRPPGLKTGDLLGQVSLVNVFASWCVSCRVEHPLFMALKEDNLLTVHGLNYKDEPAAALSWLRKFGDPYARVGADRNGRVGIDFGVYGVPETFVIAADGTIACKHIGPLSKHDIETKILPAVGALKRGERPQC
jgi:cytochrome c biogenesis protein CcmG/thiol:disulfide interchange protein DsbE